MCMYITVSFSPNCHYSYHNKRDGVSNHQHLDGLLNCLFWRRSKKTSNHLRHWPLMRGIHRWPVDSPHKGPVMQKFFHLMTSTWWLVSLISDLDCASVPVLSIISIELCYNGTWLYQLIEAGWCIYMWMSWIIIGLGNGLSLVQCQAINWTNRELCQLNP